MGAAQGAVHPLPPFVYRQCPSYRRDLSGHPFDFCAGDGQWHADSGQPDVFKLFPEAPGFLILLVQLPFPLVQSKTRYSTPDYAFSKRLALKLAKNDERVMGNGKAI